MRQSRGGWGYFWNSWIITTKLNSVDMEDDSPIFHRCFMHLRGPLPNSAVYAFASAGYSGVLSGVPFCILMAGDKG